ncbi:hypothetical protein H0H93_001585 [Arthromyces matolae]|nr:hypothetical protein H0H93_001585 [Arthromyces matolae]
MTAIVLKAHPSTRGTVRLTGSHPQDLLDIQKNHFQAADGPSDVAAIREGIKRARALVQSTPIGAFVDSEIAPGPNVTTDDEIDQYIYNRIFGHHACCTNAMGPDDDPNAVLDGNFKMSEKAADVILAAHKA